MLLHSVRTIVWPLPKQWVQWLLAIVPRDVPQPSEAQPQATAHEEREQFEQFFYAYAPRITNYLWRMLGEEQAAFDFSQETFLRAWQHFATVRTYPHPAAWLFKVATNLALNHLRRTTSSVGAMVPLAGSRAIPLASSYGDESAVAVATPYLLLTAFYLW